uniref:Uncharacterized protein n=1 Tax=Knipowitschia caucasica TaxID=637954 RepID=A0AAV2IQZ8_KNICA
MMKTMMMMKMVVQLLFGLSLCHCGMLFNTNTTGRFDLHNCTAQSPRQRALPTLEEEEQEEVEEEEEEVEEEEEEVEEVEEEDEEEVEEEEEEVEEEVV